MKYHDKRTEVNAKSIIIIVYFIIKSNCNGNERNRKERELQGGVGGVTIQISNENINTHLKSNCHF